MKYFVSYTLTILSHAYSFKVLGFLSIFAVNTQIQNTVGRDVGQLSPNAVQLPIHFLQLPCQVQASVN